MPSSPSSSAQAARKRLGEQLRQMRTERGVTGVDFARLAGWRGSPQVSMIEGGQRTITADHVRLWCRICGTSERREAELLAEQANVAGMWLTHAQLNLAGLKARQERLKDEYWTLRLNRTYQTRVFPGLLQTEAMMAFYLSRVRAEQHIEIDDVAAAVQARMDRQECLNRPDAQWAFLLEEDVLWYRSAPLEVHREQLERLVLLLETRRPASVSLGIIPRAIDRAGVIPAEAFTMTDTDSVSVELTSGYLSLTQPAEIRLYAEAWDRLWPLAVHGDQAGILITRALEAL